VLDSTAATVAAEEPPAARGWVGRAVGAVETLARICVGLAMLVILVFTSGQVVDRYLLKTSFNAYDQVARLGLVWMTFLGIAVAFRERANIRIDLLDHALPLRFVQWKSVVLDVATLVVTIVIHVEGWRLLEVGAYQTLMGTPFTYEVVYAALLVGTALLAVVLVMRIADAVLRGRFALEHGVGP
jgi:TRAP-type C4-dicarboxylate transport system permease small subunit